MRDWLSQSTLSGESKYASYIDFVLICVNARMNQQESNEFSEAKNSMKIDPGKFNGAWKQLKGICLI